MRAFVFLLILANLLFFAWVRGYFAASSDPDAQRVQQQLLAGKVKIVARDEPPAEMTKAEKAGKPVEKKMVEICVLLSDLPIADVLRVEGLLADKFPAFRSERSMNAGSGSYWVFIPPLPGRQDADRKASELRKLRVPEFFIVQDGPSRFAISLGIFSSRQAAADRLEELRAKGVKSARIGERDVKPASASLEVHGPEAQMASLRQAIAEALPESKPAACRIQSAPAQ